MPSEPRVCEKVPLFFHIESAGVTSAEDGKGECEADQAIKKRFDGIAHQRVFYAFPAASLSNTGTALVRLSTPKTTSACVEPGSSPQ